MNKQKVVIITGTTAVGKTKLSIEIAKLFNGEIISADSCQVYKGFDIGTAKISEKDKQGVEHYLIDIQNPNDEYNAGEFARQASLAIKKINSKGKLPIIVGGTGLYINSLLYPFSIECGRDEEYRKQLENIASTNGKEKLYEMLKMIDPDSAKVLHVNQIDRIIRALEIYHITGKTKSEQSIEVKSAYDYLLIVLERERSEVYNSINNRVDEMIKLGLVEEIYSLLNSGVSQGCPAMKSIGYKELLDYINGEIKLEEAIEIVKQKTRNYAKRQLTYFKKMKNAVFIDYNNKNEVILKIKEFLGEN